MSLHANFGNLEGTYEETQFEWRIVNARRIVEDDNFIYCESPRFSFGNNPWFFQLWRKSNLKPECIALCLTTTWPHEYLLEYNLSFKRKDIEMEHVVTGILKENHDQTDFLFVKRCDILPASLWRLILPFMFSQPITITCTLKRGIFLSTEPQILHNPKPKKLPENEIVRQDYKKVLLHGKNHDLILKTGDKEFPVHRDILKARSRVFESMLSHNMKEKNSGIIEICDCDPQAMEQFLLYVYCGEVESLEENNVIGLYYVADKYDVMHLKDECRDFIKELLSIVNIFEVIQLALNHSDSDLLEHATEYFCDNSQKIVRTEEWQSFLKENSATANELLIKSFDKLAKEKN